MWLNRYLSLFVMAVYMLLVVKLDSMNKGENGEAAYIIIVLLVSHQVGWFMSISRKYTYDK